MEIIHLISGPRNISTALMYSFAQRPDTAVLDEPFYAVYLRKTGVVHPGTEEVLASQPQDEDRVVEQIKVCTEKPVVFIKNMAHHLEILEGELPFKTKDVFLIRNPRQILASYAQVIENPVMRDIGLKFQFDLFNQQYRKGRDPVVIDSNMLLANPVEVLRHLCRRIDLPFHSEMLQWKPAPKSYDGIWAKYWYKNVHKSASFEKQETSNRELPNDLNELYKEALLYYEQLLPYAIRP